MTPEELWEQMNQCMMIPSRYFYTSSRIGRVIEVWGLWKRARLRGLRNGYGEARMYRRLFKSLVRP